MKIGGLQKLTLIDYPGKLACTVFLSGCNFGCPWCYSPELVVPEKIKEQVEIKEKDFFDFLENRKGKIEGVVICGGEPTIHEELPKFIQEIRDKGFLVKLDTNGSNPEVLKNLLESGIVNYVAMDFKGPLEKYKEVTGTEVDTNKIKESIDIIKRAGIDYEFRTTLVPGIHRKEDIAQMGEVIRGAKKYFLQNFLPEKTIKGDFLGKKPFIQKELEEFQEAAEPFVENCEIRY